MGIKKIFKVKLPSSNDTIGDLYTIVNIEGKRIGVDAMVLLYECLNNGPLLKDSEGRITLHIKTLVSKILRDPNEQLFVFDNSVKDKAKSETIKKRANYKSEVFNHIKLSDAIKDFKTVLTLFEIPYVTAPPEIEAESYLVELKRLDVIDYILTTDTDVLAYGSDMLVYTKNGYKLYQIKRIIKALNISLEAFRVMCCLLGNDFNEKVKGVTHLRILDYLDHELTSKMKSTYVLFSLRVQLIHTKEQLTPKHPVIKQELADYLRKRTFVNLPNKLEKDYIR